MESYYIHDEETHNLKAPREIIPIIQSFGEIGSALDVGCGIGTWLSVAESMGIGDVFGIDGAYVDRELLSKFISLNCFEAFDLNIPFDLHRKFDLVICLEVAEHLCAKVSDVFVKSLVDHSDVILFSAAIPGQGGQNHVNERWPEYWAKKFNVYDYVFLDLIRPQIWNNDQVDYWYKQNTFLVVKKSHPLAKSNPESYLPLVHPELLARVQDNSLKQIKSLKANLAIHPLKRWVKSLIS
jgi:SAM-dependent methyltransferase